MFGDYWLEGEWFLLEGLAKQPVMYVFVSQGRDFLWFDAQSSFMNRLGILLTFHPLTIKHNLSHQTMLF